MGLFSPAVVGNMLHSQIKASMLKKKKKEVSPVEATFNKRAVGLVSGPQGLHIYVKFVERLLCARAYLTYIFCIKSHSGLIRLVLIFRLKY